MLRKLQSALTILVPVAIVPVVVIFILYWHYGSLSAIDAHRAGFVLYSDGPTQAVSGNPGEKIRIPFPIQNLAWSPVTVYGASTACSCTQIEGLPLTIPAGTSRDVVMMYSVAEGERKDEVVGEVTLYTSPPGNPLLVQASVSLVADSR